jgi:hypothetical protein
VGLCLTTNISEALVDNSLRRYQVQSSAYAYLDLEFIETASNRVWQVLCKT